MDQANFTSRVRTMAGLCVSLCMAQGGPVHGQNVVTQHNDTFRTGATLQETTLTTANVNAASFGKLYSRVVDGEIFAQPLYVQGVSVPGRGVHDVVYVATMKNNIYAFDADDNDPNPQAGLLWGPINLGRPEQGRVDLNGIAPPGQACPSAAYYGIASTPVINPANSTMYVVAKTIDGTGAPHQMLHSLDIRSGAANEPNPTHSPVEISSKSDTGIIAQQLSRAGLLLSNGRVYLALAGHCDFPVDARQTPAGSYHGWVFAYDTATFEKRGEFNTTPDGIRGGVWQSGNGIAADPEGNVYFQTGNESNIGEGSKPHPPSDVAESIVRLDPNLANPAVFPPTGQPAPSYLDYAHLDSQDLDLTSSGPMLFPAPGTADLITGGKPGRLFLVDRASMNLKQTFKATVNNSNAALTPEQCTYGPDHYDPKSSVPNTLCPHIHSGLVFWQTTDPQVANIYVWGERDYLRMYRYNTATRLVIGHDGAALQQPPALNLDGPAHSVQGDVMVPLNDPDDQSRVMPGGTLSLSANGSAPGSAILWATHVIRDNAEYKDVGGMLRAYDAATLHELWNSGADQFGPDFLGKHAKYAPVSIAKGKVYAATDSNRLVVYGLKSVAQPFLPPWQEPIDIGPATTQQARTFPTGTQVFPLSRAPGIVDLYLIDKTGVRNAGYVLPGGQYSWGYPIPRAAGQPPTVPGSLVAATARNASTVDLFSVLADGSVWNVGYWSAGAANGGFNGGYPIPGAGAGFAKPGIPLATLNRNEGQADLFVVRADGSVWNAGHWSQGTNGPGAFGWNPGYPIPGAGPGFATPDTSVTVLSRAADTVDLFVVRADGSVWNAGHWAAGAVGPGPFGWNPGYPIPGAGAGYAPAGTPVAAISRGPDVVDLFVTRSDGSVWNAGHWLANAPGPGAFGWSAGYPIVQAGAGFATPGGRISVVQRDQNHTDLYIVRPDGTLWNAGWWAGDVAGKGPFGWNPGYWVGQGLAVEPNASVRGLARGPGHVDLFVPARDGQVLSPWWDVAVR